VIVDTHVHVVSKDEERYPLRPGGVGGDWYIEMPVSVEAQMALMARAGVDRAVLVQAVGPYSYDNRYVLDAARLDPARLAVVCALDPAAEQPGAVHRLADLGAGGVRLFAIEAGPRPAPWLEDSSLTPAWEAAAELGLPMVVTMLPSQLPALARLLDRFPAATVALDHCGFAEPAQLSALARFPNLHLKVSSITLSSSEPRPLVEELAAVFGIDRLLWGSDFPQIHDRPYGELAELASFASSRLAPDEQAKFLGGNALRLWPPPPTS
jgi:L-fuconolactonase